MGPLVPDIISPNLNYIVALIIGVFFGAILEQAGFSTSKKLVGLFYGYDFTVLRVFFTAGAIAMVGVIAFNHYGIIDMSLVYVNPTFLWSAIIGGLIMGLGFVVGGFCPGTSICAAVIGKIDAMIFIAGVFIGVLIFAEGYPFFEGLYKASNLGKPQIFETLGMSQGVFAFIIVLFALFAFYVTNIIENKVNKINQPSIKTTPYFVSVLVIGLILGVASFRFSDRKADLLKLIQDDNYVMNEFGENNDTDATSSSPIISLDEFALCIIKINECSKNQIFDFRSAEDRKALPLPKAYPMTMDDLFTKEPNKLLTILHRNNIFIANDEITERRMALLATKLGYKRIRILKGGIDGLKKEILEYQPLSNPKTIADKDRNQFRLYAQAIIPEILKKYKPSENTKSDKPKRVLGGC